MVSLFQWFQSDWRRFCGQVLPNPPLKAGLYTYRFQPRGGERRVHLRVDKSGNGVMFVDVTDVVHFNSTATQIAKWALDGEPQLVAEQRLRLVSQRDDRQQIRRDLDSIYAMVGRLADPLLGCPTCSIGSVERNPLFSTPISAPYKADLAITYKCNNDCPHCYNEADRLALEAMPVEDWMSVVDHLHEVGVPHLIFTGGEATLYSDLPQLIAYANSLGPVCGLNTNGRRLAQASYAQTLSQAGLNHIQVTLGSHRPEVHDRMMNARCFEQTVQGIRNAQEAGLHTITNTTLMQMNAVEIVQTIDFLYSLGIRTFAINGMIYSGGGFDTGQAIPEQLMPALLVRIRDRAAELGMKFLWYTPTMYCRLSPVELEIGAKRCNAGEYSMCVEPNGDVLPCQSFYVAAGNLLRDPWEKIWHSPLFHSFRDREQDPKAAGLPEMCWTCPDLQLCGGGCRIEREAAEGVRSAGSCSSGGCSSGGCSSGGCSTKKSSLAVNSRQTSGGSTGSIQLVQVSLNGTGRLPTAEVVSNDCSIQQETNLSGFVPLQALHITRSSPKRRGTGVFAKD
jgi:radical SAM protein with 4Fe4S-binding SPASM domain